LELLHLTEEVPLHGVSALEVGRFENLLAEPFKLNDGDHFVSFLEFLYLFQMGLHNSLALSPVLGVVA
jgi:hypothetical protein